ncbi:MULTISPECIES: hypothetical protein [unclassified Micromonospora]|uniref:hypothetical protein n=1 Tax=unclassified Micromonospora TaxID=2617518 RepID=UPI002FEECA01
MASRPPSGYQIRKVHATLGKLQRYTLNKPLTFRCVTCRRTNMSSSVVTVSGDWSQLLCGGCYGQQAAPQAGTARTPAPRVPTARAQPETQWTSSPLPRDMVWLAAMHRSVAEGKQLSPSEQELHRRRAGEPPSIAAIRYAELLVDVEARIAQLSGGAAEELTVTREKLSLRREEAVETFRAACHARSRPAPGGSVEEPVEALVIQQVAPHAFDKAFTKALRRRGVQVGALEPPTSDVWAWLQTHDKQTSELPAEVKRLRKLNGADFTREAVAEVNRWECDQSMAHPAVAEQWAACTEEILTELARARRSLEVDLSGGRGNGVVPRLRRAGEAYARGSARCLEAQLIVADLLAHASQLHRARKVPKARAESAAEATMAVRQADPALARYVDRAIEEHRRSCPKLSPKEGHAGCASSVAQVVRSRLQPVDLPVNAKGEPREPGPGEGSAEEARSTLPPQSAHEAVAFLSPELLEQVPTEVAHVVGVVNPSDSDADDRSEAFVCEAVRRQVPRDSAYLAAVAAVDFDRSTGIFGYAWLTEEGELRTGTDRAVDVQDCGVQAICRTALDLVTGTSNVQVICRDDRAAKVVLHVLRAGFVPEALGFPVAGHTRLLLAEVIRHRKRLLVATDSCLDRHRGAAAAAHLADLASRAGRGSEPRSAVQAEADRISQHFGRAVGARLTGPTEEDDHAWWLSDKPRDEDLVWQTALYRMHLQGGWCVLPDGRLPLREDRRRLQLRVEHRDRGPAPTAAMQNVTLRRRGGQWEIGGIRWPKDLLPGTVVTFRWRRGSAHISARTALLPQPERVDDLEFRHRYDRQVVTRETAPGADQDRDVPDLSDASWVMRTLRKLGYLSVDGEAILAEDALVRNCLELGLPPHRADRIGPAVEQLLRAGRLHRVKGSVDYDGRPWYPPRPGHVRTLLLRYVPQIQAVTPQRDITGEWRPHRRGHWVTGFVRRLPAGAQASAEQIDAHRDAVRASELVDRDLPEGFTYVRRHRRAR